MNCSRSSRAFRSDSGRSSKREVFVLVESDEAGAELAARAGGGAELPSGLKRPGACAVFAGAAAGAVLKENGCPCCCEEAGAKEKVAAGAALAGGAVGKPKEGVALDVAAG